MLEGFFYPLFVYHRTQLAFYAYYREEHTQRKIDKLVADAKAKMAKGDKKGKLSRPNLFHRYPFSWTFFSLKFNRCSIFDEKEEASRGGDG